MGGVQAGVGVGRVMVQVLQITLLHQSAVSALKLDAQRGMQDTHAGLSIIST